MRKTVGVIFMCAFLPLLAMAQTGIPGKTIADEVLQEDITQKIDEFQAALAPDCKHEITDTRVKTVFEMPTGLLIILEEWFVKSCDKKFVYLVEIKESRGGGVDFTVSTPRLVVSKSLEDEE